MKFSKNKELYNFLQEKQIFADLKEIREIYTGGSSFNFYILDGKKEYLLKLVDSRIKKQYLRIKEILKIMGLLYPIKENTFDKYYLLVQPYINGRKIRYKDCSLPVVHNLVKEYRKINNGEIPPEIVVPQQEMMQVKTKISAYLSQSKLLVDKIIAKYFWQRVEPELVYLPQTTNLIHGDLTANNILIDKDKNIHIIDFEWARYGYSIEDICYLLLQLSGFRGMFGSIRKGLNLCSKMEAKSNITPEMWLYGIQLFYLNTLIRRFFGGHKKRSLRKDICLIIHLTGYFRLVKEIKKKMS